MSHPIRGLIYALKSDSAFQIEIIGGAIALFILHFAFGPFSAEGQLLLIFCWFLVMITELQNSAVETALDQIHPEHHEKIGRSKDLAAAAVIWAATFSLISLIFVLSGKI